MLAKATFNFGGINYEFQFDEKTDKETLNKIITLSNPPKYCDNCKNEKFFKFTTNKDTEGNIYINVKCTSCGAKSKLGEYKTGGYFWKRPFELYKKDEAKTEEKGADKE